MKKRILSAILCIALIVTALPVSFITDAATYPSDFTSITFTAKANTSAGLSADKTMTMTGSGSAFTLSLDLFESATPQNISVSWNNTSYVTIKDNSKTYTSGSLKLPAFGTSASYTMTINTARSTTKTATITLVTNKIEFTDPNVANMNINIDETIYDEFCGTNEKCTISRMNNDTYHERICYGTVEFEGKTFRMSIKGRGNYTWQWEKKPYNLTTYDTTEIKEGDDPKKAENVFVDKKKSEFIKGVKSKKWSLLANYSDSTLLRNKIGYDLANRLGIGLESRFVNLFMNGEFLGNYLLTPKTDYNSPDYGYILELDNKVEKTATSSRPDFVPDYQFSYDNIKPHYSGTSIDSFNGFTIKDKGVQKGVLNADGKEKVDITNQMIEDATREALDAVWDTTKDPENYLNYFDLDSWAKMYLMYEFVKNYDTISGSMFMYRNGTTPEDKLIAGPVWDLDNSMGHKDTCPYSSSALTASVQKGANGWIIDTINPTEAQSILQFLGKHESFMTRVYQIYNEYKPAFEQTLTEIDTQAKFIEKSIQLNFARWNINQNSYNNFRLTSATSYDTSTKYAVNYVATTTYDNYLSNLKEYVKSRLLFFSDKMTVENPATVTITGKTAYNVGDTVALSATTSASSCTWQSSKNGTEWSDIDDSANKTYTFSATSKTDGKQYRAKALTTTTTLVSTKNVATVNLSAYSFSEPLSLHVHSYGKDWITDSESHWHECDCGEIGSLEVHKYSNNCDTDCDVCGYTRTVGDHDFTYSYVDNGDGTHSGKCSCGVVSTEKSVHIDVLDDNECDICGGFLRHPVSDDTSKFTSGEWLVKGNVSADTPITVEGDVSLYLGDGAVFEALKGIIVKEGNTLTVFGNGDIYAVGEDFTAGIGSQIKDKAGTIIINITGTVTAVGGYGAAGIGSGLGGESSVIIIESGTVFATGGDGGGAGIGGGIRGDGGIITINGGTVTATGTLGGAGIGGGMGGAGGTITVNDGTITATGGMGGAGIGGGYGAASGTVKINGTAHLTATGGRALGCGDGIAQTSQNITVSPMLQMTANAVKIATVGDETEIIILARTIVSGDVSGDEKINVTDCVLIAKYIAKKIDFTLDKIVAADMTGDGKVDEDDLLYLNKLIAKLI